MSNERPTYAQRMIQAQAKEIADRATAEAMRLAYADWDVVHRASRLAVAEALSCLMQDAAFYAEDSVPVYRLRRLKEQLNPADTSGADT